MKPRTTTTTEPRQNVPLWELPTEADELTFCEKVRFYALRAMDTSHGESSALSDIRRGCYTDKFWKDAESRNSRAVDLHALADEERAEANKARQLSKRIRISDEERAEAEKALARLTTLADNDRAEATDTEQLNNELIATLAEDMLIHIWIELQAIKANPERQTAEAFGELCRAGREFIESLSAVSIVDKMTTISRPLSREDAIYYMTRYSADPKARPRNKWAAQYGYYTLEPMARKKDLDPAKVDPAIIANYARFNDACIWYHDNITLPTTHSASASETLYNLDLDAKDIATRFWHRQTQTEKVACLGLDPTENPVLYLVLHVPTIRAEYSADHLSDEDPRTAEAVADAVLSSVDVIRLAQRANLSPQARTAVVALCSPDAVAVARTAYNKAMATGKASLEEQQTRRAVEGKKKMRPGRVRQLVKQYTDHANNVYRHALWDHALSVAEYAEASRPKAQHTIIKKLTRAYREAPDELTPGYIDYTALMRGSYRGQAQPTPPADLLKWTITAPKPGHKPVIRFTDSGIAPTATNPGIDYRAALVIYLDSQRTTAPTATAPARSAREQAQYEALCIKESELVELWNAFQNGDPIPEHIEKRRPTKEIKENSVYELINQKWTARPPKDAELSAMVFLMDARNADPAQLAKVAPGAVIKTKYGFGKIANVKGDLITVRINRSEKHTFNAPLAIAQGTIEII